MFAVESKLRELAQHREAQWAWNNFIPTVHDIISSAKFRSVLEVGGGRMPSLSVSDVEELGLRYTVNDISERELSLAPVWVSRACFDIQTSSSADVQPFDGQYDFIFSRMVMEHVESYERAYSNLFRLLAPGGISISFHPVLYSFPFVVNRLLPEEMSARLLRFVFPNRTDSEIPKFPAHYSGCAITTGVRESIRRIGFSGVWQVPFFGHNYYSKIPLLRDIHPVVSRLLMRWDISPLASFCYTIVQR